MTTKPTGPEGLLRIWGSGASNPSEIVDPDTIVAGKVAQGWAEEYPPFQFANWILHFVSKYLAHINEQGTPLWDAATDYPVGGLAKSSVDARVYRSLVTPNTNNEPSVSPTQWAVDATGASTFYADSGGIGTFQLTNVDAFSVPKKYNDGMVVRFVPANNSSTATAQIGALGAKTVVTETGSTNINGLIVTSRIAELYFDEGNDRFVLRQAYSPAASEAVPGVLEIATQTEANGASDDSRALTALKLYNRTATETRRGVAEIATDGEVTAGTDDTTIITPLKLKNRFFKGLKLSEIVVPSDSVSSSASGSTNIVSMTSIPVGSYKFKCFVNANMASAPTTESASFGFTTGTNDIQFSVKAISAVTTTPEFKYSSTSAIAFTNPVTTGDSTTGTSDVFFEADGVVTYESSSNLNLVAVTDGISINIRHAIMVLERVEDIDIV